MRVGSKARGLQAIIVVVFLCAGPAPASPTQCCQSGQPPASLLQLRGGAGALPRVAGKRARVAGKRARATRTEGGNKARSKARSAAADATGQKAQGGGKRSEEGAKVPEQETAGNEAGPASGSTQQHAVVAGLLADMKEMLLKGVMPAPLPPPPARPVVPRKGPGSERRTARRFGWSRNPGGEFGVVLPEGGLAGGGVVPEPHRVAWARRLANASDTAAHLGHKLVQMCDNVSAGIDPYTEKGDFYLDTGAALECIKKGADVNGRGPFDLTPLLMLCAADGHERVIARMLARGADVHAQDVAGNTALHEAVRCRAPKDMRSVETVKLLLAAGANASQPDSFNATALDAAHTALARLSWWSGVQSAEAHRAMEIVALLGGNVRHGAEQVLQQAAKLERRLGRERAREDARRQTQAAALQATPRQPVEYSSIQ